MPKAVWNGAVLAQSDETIVVEGNHYFPATSVNDTYLQNSDAQTVCYWKGVASYYDVVVEDETNREAAFYYPDPSDAASGVKDYVAFWRGVRIEA